MFLITINSFTR